MKKSVLCFICLSTESWFKGCQTKVVLVVICIQFQPSCHTDMLCPLRLKWLLNWWTKLSGPRVMWRRPATWPSAGVGVLQKSVVLQLSITKPAESFAAKLRLSAFTFHFWRKPRTTSWCLTLAILKLEEILQLMRPPLKSWGHLADLLRFGPGKFQHWWQRCSMYFHKAITIHR